MAIAEDVASQVPVETGVYIARTQLKLFDIKWRSRRNAPVFPDIMLGATTISDASLFKSDLYALKAALIVPLNNLNGAPSLPKVGVMGAGSSPPREISKREREPSAGAPASVSSSPKALKLRLNFLAIGSSSLVSLALSAETDLRRISMSDGTVEI